MYFFTLEKLQNSLIAKVIITKKEVLEDQVFALNFEFLFSSDSMQLILQVLQLNSLPQGHHLISLGTINCKFSHSNLVKNEIICNIALLCYKC